MYGANQSFYLLTSQLFSRDFHLYAGNTPQRSLMLKNQCLSLDLSHLHVFTIHEDSDISLHVRLICTMEKEMSSKCRAAFSQVRLSLRVQGFWRAKKKKKKKNSVHLRLLQLGYKMDDEAN